jgi:hypothetical protein
MLFKCGLNRSFLPWYLGTLNIAKTMRAATAIVLAVAMALVLISPIAELDAAVHHRSHHSLSLALSAEIAVILLTGSVARVESRKTVHEHPLAARQPALLRC